MTIDVAYRFFATARRRYIVADTPGHEQYTRNMVSGASTAAAAVLIVDARKGVLAQTRRHSYIACAAGHPPHPRRGEQDGPGRLRRSAVSRRGRRVAQLRRAHRARRAGLRPGVRAARATTWSRRAPTCPGTAGRRSWAGWKRWRSARRARRRGVPLSGAVGRPAHHDFRGFAGTIAGGAIRSRRACSGAALGAREHGGAHRHRRRRPASAPSPARRSPSRWPTRSTSRAAT